MSDKCACITAPDTPGLLITPRFAKLYGIHACIDYQVYKEIALYCKSLDQSFNTSLNVQTLICKIFIPIEIWLIE